MEAHERSAVRDDVLAQAEEVLAGVERRWDKEETRVAPIVVDTFPDDDDSFPESAEAYFDRFYPYAAGAVVTDQAGRLLCVYSPARDEWETPGGAGEPDETPAETAQRETFEESGIETEITGVLLTRLMEIRLDAPETLPIPIAVFTAQPIGGELLDGTELEQNDEVTDIMWFGPKELPTNLRGYEWKHAYLETLTDSTEDR